MILAVTGYLASWIHGISQVRAACLSMIKMWASKREPGDSPVGRSCFGGFSGRCWSRLEKPQKNHRKYTVPFDKEWLTWKQVAILQHIGLYTGMNHTVHIM